MNSKLIGEILAYADEPMELYMITNDNQLVYNIGEIEKLIRRSLEYRGGVTSKKYKHKQTTCKAYDINVLDYDEVKIEQDHFPISLGDIVGIVRSKMINDLEENEYLTTFDIASQVIKEHLEDQHIGSVCLMTSFHQLRHAGVYKVNKEDIHGDYQAFLDKYKGFIPRAAYERIKENLDMEVEE